MQYNSVCNENTWMTTSYDIKDSHSQLTSLYSNEGIDRGETRCWNLRGNTSTYETGCDVEGVVMIAGLNQTMLTLFAEGKDFAESQDKQRDEVTTWDTFCVAQQHYNVTTVWLMEAIEKLNKTNEDITKFEKKLVEYTPSDYVSKWTLM